MSTFFSRFTPEQLRDQYRKNAAQLWAMHAKAVERECKVNGFTAEQLKKYAENAERKTQP